MDDLTPAPSPLLKTFAMVARWSLALLLIAWLLLAMAWAALHLLIVPRIGELRPLLERTASHVLGVSVRIESISAYSTGMIPAFEMTNITLADPQGREALRLPRVLVSLSPQSLLALRFDQLYVDYPVLNVRRLADGKILVAGLDFSGTGQSDDAALDHVFSQPEFVIRHGSMVWTDELRGAPPIALHDVDLVLRNTGRRHELRFDATPPSEWGERFGITARFEQPFLSMNNGRWREWSGEAHAAFSRVELSELRKVADLGLEVHQGGGALRAWIDVRRARVTAATADLALARVSLRLDAALPALELATLSGRVSAQFPVGGLEFSTQALAFETAQGLLWPGGNVKLSLVGGDATRPAHGELTADRLDLAALSQIAGRLPVGAPMLAALARYDPSGQVPRLRAKWIGAPDAVRKYEVQGRVEQLRIKSIPAPVARAADSSVVPGSPGIDGATVDFDLSESAGKATLAMKDGSISLPGIFEEPIVPFAQLAANISWQVDGERLQVQAQGLRFANADAQGELQLRWQTSDPARSSGGSRFPGILDLQGSLERATANRVYRYLPLVLQQDVRHYVRDAVLAGASGNVRFRVKGDLWDMPFAKPAQGEFSITASVKDGVLAYLPRRIQSGDSLPWPVLGQLAGELVLDRKSLRFSGVRGNLVAAPLVQISRGEGSIADLMQSSVVALAFDARGPLADCLAVVNSSPIGELAGSTLARATANGNADLRLKMSIPLATPERVVLQGAVTLAGNDFQLSPDIPRMSRARGVFAFSESGFSLNGIQTRVFGGDVRLDGGTIAPVAGARGTTSLALRAQGVASAEGLRQTRELGALSRMAQYASGSAAYSASITLRAGVPEISFSSNLVGLALDLPAPLGKAADAIVPLLVESALLRESMIPGPGGRVRLLDQLSVDMGRLGSVTYVRDLSAAEPRVLRGAIGVGLAADESPVLPAEGVIANINLGLVDLDAWGKILDQVSGTPVTVIETPGQGAAEAAMRSYLPQSIAIRARELVAGGRKLRAVVVGGSRDGSVWRANVDAEELNGYVEYRQSASGNPGRVFARLSRLTLAPASASDVEKLLDDQPASIPALDIVVYDLELRGKRMGRVEVEAANRAVGGRDPSLREWRLNRFDIIMPEAVFRASGNWAAINAQSAGATATVSGQVEPRRTVMNFRLDIQNSGDLLARFGMKGVVRRGKGNMEGRVAWAGSPLTPDYPSMGGSFSVNMESGQFLKADPGLAKLMGVLSLQSLPRRLALDFRDVFSEGFAFDFIRGDVRIEHGIATTNNLQMKGVNAAVLMDGQADLARETQDLKVVVVPEINAGTASLIATVINPAVGLGSFLAQLFLRRPLMEAATQEFRVEGSWVDPKITRVARRAAPPAAVGKAAGTNTEKSTEETP